MSTSIPALAARAALAACLAGALPALVHAQGTEEQQEACAPDAVRLCQDTIPDIPKTTACMKAHFAQLSSRCKVAFNTATSSGPAASEAEPAAPAAPAPDQGFAGLPAVPVPQTSVPGLAAYRAHIVELCRQGLIDPFTCHNTLQALSDVP